MPLPTTAELTDPNATNAQMKQRLGQLVENVAENGRINVNNNLKDYVSGGTWGIASSVVNEGISAGNLGYPASEGSGPAKLDVAVTANGYAVQIFYHGLYIYKRIVNVSNQSVYEDWTSISTSPSNVDIKIAAKIKEKFDTVKANDNLNNYVTAGSWGISSSVTTTGISAGNLGYPVSAGSGSAKFDVVVVTSGDYAVQTLLHGAYLYKRIVNVATKTVYQDWEQVNTPPSSINSTISNKFKEYFDSVKVSESLNSYVRPGSWGIANATVSAGISAGNLGYPASEGSGSAKFDVAVTANSYAVQTFTHGLYIYKRIVNVSNQSVYEDWQLLVKPVGNNFASSGSVASGAHLDSYRTPGVYAITSANMSAGISAGNLGYPSFLSAVGGGQLIVTAAGSYVYQTIICARQNIIAARQSLTASTFYAWNDTLGISTSLNKTVLTFGSSSFDYMSAKMKAMVESLGGAYKNSAIGGQILETMMARQESNKLFIKFTSGITPSNNTAEAITIRQENALGSLVAKGSHTVTLENGLVGTLNLDNMTFKPTNASEQYSVGTLEFSVDFGYLKYREQSIHIFNTGKNNLSTGYTAETVFNATKAMIDFITEKANRRFIVVGYFVNKGSTAAVKTQILQCNALLKTTYGEHYFDMQDYLMSEQIWTDLGITPTADDIAKQAAGQLAVSLARDDAHVSPDVDTLFVEKLKQKIIHLGYLGS